MKGRHWFVLGFVVVYLVMVALLGGIAREVRADKSPIPPPDCPSGCIVVYTPGVPVCDEWCVEVLVSPIRATPTMTTAPPVLSEWWDTGELWMGKYKLFVNAVGEYCVEDCV